MKRCSKCKQVKPITEFNRQSQQKDGLRPSCRLCQKADGLIYANAHREQIAAYGARYFRDHRTEIMAKKPERDHRYAWQLRQRIFAQYGNTCTCCGETTIYFLQITHPDGRQAPHVADIGYVGGDAVCRYLKKHHYPDAYRLLCANCLRALSSFRFCPHHDIDSRQMSGGLLRRWNLRCEVLQAYGNHCTCCGESNPYFLEVDHPNGDGQQERAALGLTAGSRFYRYLKQEGFPQRYRLLCSNCNTSRGWYGFCPHVDKVPQSWQTTAALFIVGRK